MSKEDTSKEPKSPERPAAAAAAAAAAAEADDHKPSSEPLSPASKKSDAEPEPAPKKQRKRREFDLTKDSRGVLIEISSAKGVWSTEEESALFEEIKKLDDDLYCGIVSCTSAMSSAGKSIDDGFPMPPPTKDEEASVHYCDNRFINLGADNALAKGKDKFQMRFVNVLHSNVCTVIKALVNAGHTILFVEPRSIKKHCGPLAPIEKEPAKDETAAAAPAADGAAAATAESNGTGGAKRKRTKKKGAAPVRKTPARAVVANAASRAAKKVVEVQAKREARDKREAAANARKKMKEELAGDDDKENDNDASSGSDYSDGGDGSGSDETDEDEADAPKKKKRRTKGREPDDETKQSINSLLERVEAICAALQKSGIPVVVPSPDAKALLELANGKPAEVKPDKAKPEDKQENAPKSPMAD
jgi:hypothetical protein